MSQITEQIEELRQYASERKGEIADICNRAADTIEDLSEKLRTSRYSEAEIQKMQELEQAELQKACEIGRELERMEQETCEDKYIKVPKKALKYRTAGMVAYNAEWLKDHFDIERAVICGAQQPCDDVISRQAAIDAVNISNLNLGIVEALQSILAELPPVTPQPSGNAIDRKLVCAFIAGLISDDREREKGLEYIRNMPSVNPTKTGKLIPVSEKLPNDRNWYLGIFKEPDTGWINPLPFICDYVGYETKATTKDYWILRGFTDRDERIDYYFNLECVAWMPLPETCNAESEDKG